MNPLTTLCFAGLALATGLHAETLYFGKVAGDVEYQVSLEIDGDQVSGIQSILRNPASFYGEFEGQKQADGTYRAIWNAEVDTHAAPSEILFKLKGDKLIMADGEQSKNAEGVFVFKRPQDAKFTLVLPRLPVETPAPNSSEGEPISSAVLAAAAKVAGAPLKWKHCEIRVSGDSAICAGRFEAAETGGKDVPDRKFQALLSQSGKTWTVLSGEFAGPEGFFSHQSYTGPSLPWQLYGNP